MPARPPKETAPADQPVDLRRQKRKRPLAAWAGMAVGLAAAAVIAWFAWTAGLFVSDRAAPPRVDAEMRDKRAAAVKGSVIRGTDAKGQPYRLHARISVRADADKNLVHMRDVDGELRKANGEKVLFRADAADYDRRKQQALLKDNVRIETKGRYTLLTPRALVKVQEKELSSDSPLTVLLTNGWIKARGIRTGQNMDRIRFLGRVHVHYDAGREDAAQKGARDGKGARLPAPARN